MSGERPPDPPSRHSGQHDPTPELPTDPDLATQTDSSGSRKWDLVAVIAAGGAIGGGLRYGISQAWPHDGSGFPWATFVENVSGSLLLGALMVFLLDVWGPHRYLRPFLGVGLLGGFTTFSTFTNEADTLLRGGQGVVALAYVFGSVAAGLLAALCGIAGARRVAGVQRRSVTRCC